MLRRDALRFFGQGAAGLSLAPLTASFNAAQAATTDTEDFKALVCIFLFGGNDHSNTVVPSSAAAYQAYAKARPEIALAMNTLNPLTGTSLGLHPALVDIQSLYNQGKAALVANVGTLVQPISKAEWNKGYATVPVPKQLFSHSDQATVWQTAAPTSSVKTGWLGRMNDAVGAQYNAGVATPFVFSAGAPNLMTVGNTTEPFQVSAGGAAEANMSTFLFGATRAQAATNEILGAGGNNPMMRHWSRVGMRALGTSRTINTALNGVSLSTTFPNTPIGQQLSVIAKLIAARRQLGHKRQVYFASMVGFDQHDNLLYNHNKNLAMLNDAVKAFYASTVAQGVSDKVTSFTASDFGRALQTNGKGSDHGWGGHHFVIGGSVKGGAIYGKFPTVDLGTADDAGQGRLIPSTAMDQYAATLGKWLGADSAALNTALPNLKNFATADLGFLA